MANPGDENGVVRLVELIERKVASCTEGNDQPVTRSPSSKVTVTVLCVAHNLYYVKL